MAVAPYSTWRQTPTGVQIDDGYRTLIAFASDPTVSLWEKTVTPPGMDGGDPIDTTTMHNNVYRTFASRALVSMTGSSFTAAWDPNVYCSIVNLINLEDMITVWFPNGDSVAFYGFLQTFEPQEHVEGAQPEANCVINVTNNDPNDNEEQGPVWQTGPGTGTGRAGCA